MPTSDYLEIVLDQIDEIAPKYRGDLRKLALAVGIAVLTDKYGWRVTKLIWGAHTWKKSKDLLDLDIESIAPDETQHSKKSLAYQAWKKNKDFWRVMRGRAGYRPENGKLSDIL